MHNERSYMDPTEGADALGEAMSPAELQAAVAADLNELRAVTMRFVRRLDAKADTVEGEEMLPQLNTAVVKAARAVRQIAVLQLEVAGLRQQPNARAPAAAPANQNTEKHKTSYGNRPCPRPWDDGDYNDYDDYTDEERDIVARAGLNARMVTVVDAMNADFRAAGRDDVLNQSPRTKFEMILGIPHPKTDECIKDLEHELVYYFFGENVLPPRLGPGPPDVWAKWDADRKRHGLDRRDSG